MTKFKFLILFIILSSITNPVFADQTETYCLQEEITGDTGHSQIKLGTHAMEVNFIIRGNNTFISFEDYMPDSGQILSNSEPSQAKKNSKGDYEFIFTDNWDGHGKGVFNQSGNTANITLERVKAPSDTWGINAGRQYGSNTLTKSACKTEKK